MTDTATLTTRLEEAEAALHKLRIGAQAVSVEFDGYRETVTATNVGELTAYIDQLKRDLGQTPRRRRAARVTF